MNFYSSFISLIVSSVIITVHGADPDFFVYIQNGSYTFEVFIYGVNSGTVFEMYGQTMNMLMGSLNYHIHQFQVQNGSCAETGGHFSQDGSVYPCPYDDMSNCEYGDLSGKHGAIYLDGSTSKFGPYTFTDTTVTLDFSPTSILGKSMVFHYGSARIGCGNILPYSLYASTSGKAQPQGNGALQSTLSAMDSHPATPIYSDNSNNSGIVAVGVIVLIMGAVVATVYAFKTYKQRATDVKRHKTQFIALEDTSDPVV